MKKFISTFIVLWLIWVMLAGFSLTEIIVGGAVSIILSIIIYKNVDYSFDFTLPVKLFKFVLIYLPLFIYKLIIANFDIAYRVLSPSLPINPGFVKVPTKLSGNIGKLTLANSITLTPGTLSIDVDDENVYIHWVNVKGKDNYEYQKEVCASFEKVLGGIFK